MKTKKSVVAKTKHSMLWSKIELKILSDILRRGKGFIFSEYKSGCIMRRISSRMFATESDSLKDYISILESDGNELDKLHDTLTINESSFFRNKAVFQYIAGDIFRKVIKEKIDKHINRIDIWSMGCSTGEEPYSLAYMLRSKLGIKVKKVKVNILATDVDQKALRNAKNAIYKENKVERLDRKIIRGMFSNLKGEYKVKPTYREMVNFKRQDLLEFKPMKGLFDMIICRNLLIYFTDSNHVRAYDYFNRHLVKSGYLVLGKAEVMLTPRKRNFIQASLKHRIYQKIV